MHSSSRSLWQLLFSWSGQGYACEVQGYKDLLQSSVVFISERSAKAKGVTSFFMCGETEARAGKGVCPRSDTEQVSRRTQASGAHCCHLQTKLLTSGLLI